MSPIAHDVLMARISLVRAELEQADAAALNGLMAWHEDDSDENEQVLMDRARKVYNLRGLLTALRQEAGGGAV